MIVESDYDKGLKRYLVMTYLLVEEAFVFHGFCSFHLF